MSDLRDKAKKIVEDYLAIDGDQIHDHSSFIDDLNADSLDTVEIVMAFEEEFDVEISDEAAENVNTFGEAVALLEKLKA